MSAVGPLLGSRIELVPVSGDHERHYRRWFNDFQVQRTSGLLPMPWTETRFAGWFKRRVKSDQNAVWFTIVERSTGRPVGFCGIRDIDHHHRTGEYFITIGEADSRGRGFGTEATELTLEHAFNALNLHNILLDVSSASLAGIRAYEKAGFREIGRRTECVRMGGRWYDWVFMECVATTVASSPTCPTS